MITVLQAYWQAGDVQVKGGNDYPECTELVRKPLEWLQRQGLPAEAGIGVIADPVASFVPAIRNPLESGYSQFLHALAEYYPRGGFMTKSLYGAISGAPTSLNELERALLDGLLAANPRFSENKHLSASSLGQFLGYKRDKIVDGLVLRCTHEDSKHGNAWELRKVSENEIE